MTNFFLLDFENIQPSQLYLNTAKLEALKDFDPAKSEPLPIKQLGDQIFLTDGHHRAFLFHQAGYEKLPVVWDTDDLEMDIYEACLKWCQEADVTHIKDLGNRVLSAEDYSVLWISRCQNYGKEE